jgi:hypothetical protein
LVLVYLNIQRESSQALATYREKRWRPDILAAVESFAGGAEAQDDRTLVALKRIK